MSVLLEKAEDTWVNRKVMDSGPKQMCLQPRSNELLCSAYCTLKAMAILGSGQGDSQWVAIDEAGAGDGLGVGRIGSLEPWMCGLSSTLSICMDGLYVRARRGKVMGYILFSSERCPMAPGRAGR
jgi:hypothetical protein